MTPDPDITALVDRVKRRRMKRSGAGNHRLDSTSLRTSSPVRNITHMGMDLRGAYLEALELVNVSEVARKTGRALRTLQSYKYSERRVSAAAARELVAYLQARADTLTAAAEELAAALDQEEADG